MKRAGDGMLANREVCAVAVIATSRAGRVLSVHDTVRFLGVLVGILRLPEFEEQVECKTEFKAKTTVNCFHSVEAWRRKREGWRNVWLAVSIR